MSIVCRLKTVLQSLLFGALLWPAAHAAARQDEMIVTYRTAESDRDARYNYDKAALTLALDKTVATYGPYRLVASPPMTFPRAIQSASQNEFPNFVIKLSYEDRFAGLGMRYARFPVDLGIVGYRVCFTHPEARERLAQVKTLDDLRRFRHGQGRGWADVEILRHGGFDVEEVSSYESLFQMVASRRFDLFCRGTNEILDEYNAHRDLKTLVLDETLTIAYPLPRFFFTHQSNDKLAQRIQEGLVKAFQDGSLQQAWRKNYQASIDFVALGKRQVFHLENPLLSKVDFDYRQYFYDPFARKGRRK